MAPASDRVPNEVWLRIFSYIVNGKSLKAVILTSRRFHSLGVEELLRTVAWKTPERTKNNLKFWREHSHLNRIPTALSIDLNYRAPDRYPRSGWSRTIFHSDSSHIHADNAVGMDPDDSDETMTDDEDEEDVDPYPAAFDHVLLFRNLTSLSLANGCIPLAFHSVLVGLPHLTHLALSACNIPDAALYIPSSSSSISGAAPAESASRTSPFPAFNVARPFLQLFSPFSLTCAANDWIFAGDMENINNYLERTPNLLHLTVGALFTDEDMPPLGATLPVLESFRGPANLAHGLLANLAALTVSTVLAKPKDALELIEKASRAPLHALDLRMAEWDDEVLRAISHLLPACRDVKVSFRFAQPSHHFLFNLGVEYLPRLPHLHTLHLHALTSPAGNPADFSSVGGLPGQVYGRPRAPSETRMAAVLPAEAACGEYLAVWTQYNADLRRVRFLPSCEWTRQYVGGPWRVVNVGSD
ncbi:hypothetical protein FB451DRAFT_1189262 [Mycena latifolia]|nr:hypothetical protein FB451DRAFT_1189262 [Mycena latifolia]